MDALELALRCSSLLMRTMTKDSSGAGTADTTIGEEEDDASFLTSPLRTQMNESDCERHFKLCGLFCSQLATNLRSLLSAHF